VKEEVEDVAAAAEYVLYVAGKVEMDSIPPGSHANIIVFQIKFMMMRTTAIMIVSKRWARRGLAHCAIFLTCPRGARYIAIAQNSLKFFQILRIEFTSS
jgi:hypothetical protein